MGWLASNPTTKANKAYIQSIFQENGPQAQEDMSYILASCLLLKDEDCQVENILFYQEQDPKDPLKSITRACKFDDGWGLANICKEKNYVVNLFQSKAFLGNRATHKATGLPTNHFIDYPGIIDSPDFVRALREVASQSEKNASNTVKACLDNIESAFKTPKDKLKSFENFAKHIGLKIKYGKEQSDSEKINFIKDQIGVNLKTSLIERSKSMQVLSAILDLKLSVYSSKKEKNKEIKDSLRALYSLISEHYGKYSGEKLLKKLPIVEPDLKSILREALKHAKSDPSLIKDKEASELFKLLEIEIPRQKRPSL